MPLSNSKTAYVYDVNCEPLATLHYTTLGKLIYFMQRFGFENLTDSVLEEHFNNQEDELHFCPCPYQDDVNGKTVAIVAPTFCEMNSMSEDAASDI